MWKTVNTNMVMELTKRKSSKLGKLVAKIQWKYDLNKLLQKNKQIIERRVIQYLGHFP